MDSRCDLMNFGGRNLVLEGRVRPYLRRGPVPLPILRAPLVYEFSSNAADTPQLLSVPYAPAPQKRTQFHETRATSAKYTQTYDRDNQANRLLRDLTVKDFPHGLQRQTDQADPLVVNGWFTSSLLRANLLYSSLLLTTRSLGK
ncbi:hypothetical protein T265_07256 [Opisthorchis viverrini]|uniref:Uncharacterized protein n=1 Tax=Opisthorchis viverrini TaxID=6198 RepID=A0A074ZHQ8_OPIVI|nr:hypothetical protein T265_07256 [Opisthorchis viverrini]KER25272.1 hypothetical protein T265_07256 [Opisthorchis viverrini]